MAATADAGENLQAQGGGTYDVPDLATLLKCSERHVRRMIDAGTIPGVIRIGRLVRLHRGVIDDWLTSKAKKVSR